MKCNAYVWPDDWHNQPCSHNAKWKVTGFVDGDPRYYCGIHVRSYRAKIKFTVSPISENQQQEKTENEHH